MILLKSSDCGLKNVRPSEQSTRGWFFNLKKFTEFFTRFSGTDAPSPSSEESCQDRAGFRSGIRRVFPALSRVHAVVLPKP